MARVSTRESFNQPMSSMETPRFAGIATFMRLPHVPLAQAQGHRNRHHRGAVRRRHDQPAGAAACAEANPRHVADDPAGEPGDAHLSLRSGQRRRPRRRRREPGRPQGLAQTHRGLLRQGGGGRDSPVVGRRRPPGVLSDPQSAGAKAGPGHGALRRPHRSVRRLFRRLQDHPRHALPARHRRRRARSRTHGPDRHPGLDVRLRGSRIRRQGRCAHHRDRGVRGDSASTRRWR